MLPMCGGEGAGQDTSGPVEFLLGAGSACGAVMFYRQAQLNLTP